MYMAMYACMCVCKVIIVMSLHSWGYIIKLGLPTCEKIYLIHTSTTASASASASAAEKHFDFSQIAGPIFNEYDIWDFEFIYYLQHRCTERNSLYVS